MGLLTAQRATPKVGHQGGGAGPTSSMWNLARWQEAMRPGSWATTTELLVLLHRGGGSGPACYCRLHVHNLQPAPADASYWLQDQA
jgi:hypothetical protein